MTLEETESSWTVEELFAIMERAPDLFRALDLEDVNEICAGTS